MAQKERLVELNDEEMWSPFHEELNTILHDEKAARSDNDAIKLSELCKRAVQLCYDNNDLVRMNQYIAKLTKHRAQAQKAIADMIDLAVEYIDKMPNREEKLKLVNTIRTTTEGKLFVEAQFARVTRTFCEMMEEDGKIKEGADALLEVQVETYGSLDKQEKLDYILYQLRIVLDLKDFVRTQIILKKVQQRTLDAEGMEKLKVRYYELAVRFWIHNKDTLEAAKAFHTMYETIAADKEGKLGFNNIQKDEAFTNFVTFVFISSYTNEVVDLLNRINSTYSRELERFSVLEKYTHKFLSTELMSFDQAQIEKDFSSFYAFQNSTEHHATHSKRLQKMIIQHNLRVIEGYYSRITLDRLSQLIGVGVDRCEHEIADMVVNNAIVAKINRIDGIVSFKKRQTVNDQLNVWNADVNGLLEKVEETCHLINRERVIHSK